MTLPSRCGSLTAYVHLTHTHRLLPGQRDGQHICASKLAAFFQARLNAQPFVPGFGGGRGQSQQPQQSAGLGRPAELTGFNGGQPGLQQQTPGAHGGAQYGAGLRFDSPGPGGAPPLCLQPGPPVLPGAVPPLDLLLLGCSNC